MTPRTVPPLLLSQDADLIDQVLRIAARQEVPVLAVAAKPDAIVFSGAPLVVCGADLLAELLRARLPRHRNLIIVTAEPGDTTPWDLVYELAAAYVAVLPQAADWLGAQILAAGRAW